jgi:hypothetical protein
MGQRSIPRPHNYGMRDQGGCEAINWHRWIAALFVVLELAGCPEGITGQAEPSKPPYSPASSPTMPEHEIWVAGAIACKCVEPIILLYARSAAHCGGA